jgi:RNA 2',3'-cyclic 3'-phosphodiesterase
MEMIRAFVAIDIQVENALKERWVELKFKLKNDSIKWVDEQTLHLTLFFLGDTPADMINNIAQKIEFKLRNFSSFDISLQGLGIFGSSLSPRVIWTGIAKSNQVIELNKLVCSTIIPFGFDKPSGSFTPHLTLGRVKQLRSAKELITFINSHRNEIFQESKIEKVVIYQSILKPTGPIYIPLKEIRLLSL